VGRPRPGTAVHRQARSLRTDVGTECGDGSEDNRSAWCFGPSRSCRRLDAEHLAAELVQQQRQGTGLVLAGAPPGGRVRVMERPVCGCPSCGCPGGCHAGVCFHSPCFLGHSYRFATGWGYPTHGARRGCRRGAAAHRLSPSGRTEFASCGRLISPAAFGAGTAFHGHWVCSTRADLGNVTLAHVTLCLVFPRLSVTFRGG